MRHPVVRRRIAFGLVLNAVTFGLMMWGLLSGAFWLVDTMVAAGPEGADLGFWASLWSGVITSVGWLLRVAAVVGCLVIGPVLFNLGASLVMPIFYGRIFSVARSASGAAEEAEFDTAAVARIVAVEVRRIVRFVLLSLLALLLNLVPVVGSAAYMVVQFTLSASALGWDLLSHHFELHNLSYEEQKAWVKANRSLVLTLGGVATALCAIPIVQLVFITTNVAGAGVLSARLDGAPSAPQPPPT
jgi:uncharacterized protein involved in cysteine biosynthesis